MKESKVIILFSGGLDSVLAAKLLQEQGLKILGLTFKSHFFNEEQAQKIAEQINLPLKVVDFSRQHLKMVKNPEYGYGRNINPCIDCHLLMLKKAKKIMKKERFSFVATGEVLGERPMSQNKKILKFIEKESSLNGYLLRPLSAKLLEETVPEKMGWVDRKKLLEISGRSRKRQIALAKKYKIKEYPTPAGGCLLTDPEFSKRFRELFKIFPGCQRNDVELLKLGRHFWFRRPIPKAEAEVKIIVGRSEKENRKIEKLSQKGDILIEMKNYPGPLSLVRNYGRIKIYQRILERVQELTQYYSKRARDKKDVEFKIKIVAP